MYPNFRVFRMGCLSEAQGLPDGHGLPRCASKLPRISCPHRLVSKAARCGRDGPGSTPGDDTLRRSLTLVASTCEFRYLEKKLVKPDFRATDVSENPELGAGFPFSGLAERLEPACPSQGEAQQTLVGWGPTKKLRKGIISCDGHEARSNRF